MTEINRAAQTHGLVRISAEIGFLVLSMKKYTSLVFGESGGYYTFPAVESALIDAYNDARTSGPGLGDMKPAEFLAAYLDGRPEVQKLLDDQEDKS